MIRNVTLTIRIVIQMPIKKLKYANMPKIKGKSIAQMLIIILANYAT